MEHGLHARLGALLAVAVCAGCFTSPPMHPARPLEQGERQFLLAASLYGWEDPEDGEDERWGNVEFQARSGLGPRLDGGLKTNIVTSFGIDLNYALFVDDHMAVSVNPTFEILYYEPMIFWLPVLWDCHHSERTTVTLTGFTGYYYSSMSPDEEDDLFSEVFLSGDVGETAWLYGGGIRVRVDHVVPDFRVVVFDDPDGEPLPVYMLSIGYLF